MSKQISAAIHYLICLSICGCSSDVAVSDRQSFPWEFVKIATIDTDNPEALLGGWSGGGVGIDGLGQIYVVTTAWEGAHKFDQDGSWLTNIGGEGGGPGEFRNVTDIAISKTGDLLLYDQFAGGGRLTHLDNNGKYLNSVSLRLREVLSPSFGFAGRDNFWVRDIYSEQEGSSSAIESLALINALADTLWYMSVSTSPYISLTAEGRTTGTLGPSSNSIRWTVDPGGDSWVLLPQGAQLILVRANGSQIDTMEVSLPSIEVSDAEWNQYVLTSTSYMEQIRFLQPFVDPMKTALNHLRGELHPAQRFWYVDEHGFLIDRKPYLPPHNQSGSWRYAALLPNGKMSEEIAGPAGLVAVNNGYAVQIESGWVELPRLTLYHLKPVIKDNY